MGADDAQSESSLIRLCVDAERRSNDGAHTRPRTKNAGEILEWGKFVRILSNFEQAAVSGGIVSPNGSPSGNLLDASDTHLPGQNSYGEDVPGGARHYDYVLASGERAIRAQEQLVQQIDNCTTGNLAQCALDTFGSLGSALEQGAADRAYSGGN